MERGDAYGRNGRTGEKSLSEDPIKITSGQRTSPERSIMRGAKKEEGKEKGEIWTKVRRRMRWRDKGRNETRSRFE